VNPVSGAPSLPAAAGPDAAMESFPQPPSWPGLAEASRQIGVPLDATALARFALYRDLLLDRNARINLTAIREPEEIERRLFLDALAIVPTLDRVCPVPTSTLIDVGTGAGFPGLALKIARPALDVTLVDATAKKVAFLEEVITALDLPTVRALHGRVETLGHDPAFREQFDIATARAVARLPVLLEYVVPLLRVSGTALLPKGLTIDEELRTGRKAAATLGARIVSADRLPVASTSLVIAHKAAATPTAYPRRTGIPSRAPLGERPS
jgi:16S rRNA (guanine527-N7)-methyltransferase